MTYWLKYVLAFASAFLMMLVIRTLAVSVHSISGNALAPLFHDGDQLLVNRCSYGLRIEGHGLLPYSRLLRQPVKRGDIVAFTASNISGICVARCKAIPGDTINTTKGKIVVPGLNTCAKTDYYWLEALNQENPVDSRHLGFIPERSIIGEVVTIVYNRHQLRLP